MSFKVVPSHHWGVGSTTVGGVRVNSKVRDMVITRAMGRHLRSYPHARFPDHEDLLKRLLLDDHLSRQGNSEAYPRGGVWFVCRFQIFLSFVMSCDLRFCFYFCPFILACHYLTVKNCEKDKILNYYNKRGSTSPKFPGPDLTESKESKVREIYYTALGEVHKIIRHKKKCANWN